MPQLGVRDRRGTSAPRQPPCMQEPPTKYLLPSPFLDHGLPKSVLSCGSLRARIPCTRFVPITHRQKPGYKNQVTAHLQHDDLRMEGLRMLRKAWV